MEWRPYQAEAIEAVFNDWQTYKSVMVVAATGAGKTQVMLGITDRLINEWPNARVCILAHRAELISQPKERVKDFFPHLVKKVGVVMGQAHKDDHRQIIIATVQTLGNKNGRRIKELLRYGQIDLLIIDEAHHTLPKGVYGNVINALRERNPNLRLLGVTATPERADKKDMTATFEKESANVGVRQLIEAGWLCNPTIIGVTTPIDLSGVPVVGSGATRDYNTQKLVPAVETEDVFKIVIDTHLDKCNPRPTIMFLPSVDGSYLLAELLRAKGVKAIGLDGTTPAAERAEIIEGFKTGVYTCIVNCAVLVEGFDAPMTECVHIVRPTKSDSFYLQIIGRALRQHPGKGGAYIYDYLPKDYRNLDQRLKKLGLRPPDKAVGAGTGGGQRDTKKKPKAKGEIQYTRLDYFTQGKVAWAQSKSGWNITSLGKGMDSIDRSMAINPEGTELWVVWRRPEEDMQARLHLTGEFDTLMLKSEEFIAKHGQNNLVNRKADWRKRPPSEKSLRLGQNIRVWKEGMNAGELSDAITANLVMKCIGREKSRVKANEAQLSLLPVEDVKEMVYA